jgi:NAD(P)-dependent dehydrogenase (short-subunit alcohol dehydrogenase family)
MAAADAPAAPAPSSAPPAPFSFPSSFSLAGKVAFVTGGTSGLGLAIAEGLVSAGATVVVGSRGEAKVAAAVDALGGAAAGVSGVVIDVEDPASITAAFATLLARHGGRLDLLVAAAGVLHRAKAEEEAAEDFARVLRTNVTGTFLCAQAAARAMMGAGGGGSESGGGGGAMLFIASLSSTAALADVTSYACSKAAVAQMARQLANDWARHGIRVNAIAPGVFPTAINRAAISGTPRGEWFLKQTPMARYGHPSELAGLAVYLLSPAASFTTGAVVPCDGGFLARGIGPT